MNKTCSSLTLLKQTEWGLWWVNKDMVFSDLI